MLEDSEFFTDLSNDHPFLKAAAQGFAGGGKTFTIAQIAAGLRARIQSTKPVAIFDTEESAKFLRPYFAKLGIPVIKKASRTLTDLNSTIRRCENGAADILIVDSISHVWENWIEEFKAKKRIDDIQFQHWGIIKPMWKRMFADPFVRSRVHILMTGRAGFTYGRETNEETGRKELVQTGVKMRVEGETAYEPDLLFEMQRIEVMDPKTQKRTVHREAVILKDRSTILDGKTLGPNPTYETFEPVVEFLLSDTKPPAPASTASDQDLVERTSEEQARKRDRTVLLEEIEAIFKEAAPGRSAEEKQWIVAAMRECFGSPSWTKVTMLDLDTLKKGKLALEIMRDARATPAAVDEDED